MKVAVINCSYVGMRPADRIYNLGAEKIASWHRRAGDEIYCGPWASLVLGDSFPTRAADRFYFSVIFTWDIPDMILAVNTVRSWGKEVEIGGPAATFMAGYIERETGVHPHRGLDDRFEQVPGDYQVTFTSRGCPHRCPFCGVQKVEPVAVEYDDFPLAPMIGDNNILATTWEHQVRVVDRMADFPGRIDINSGFDVRFFTEDHFQLYRRLHLASDTQRRLWRFAFDTLEVEDDVRHVAAVLRGHGFDRHDATFYCLIGFPGQTPEECRYRLDTVIGLGFNPYPMRFTPLNSLRRNYIAPGWSEDLLQRMTAYYQTPYLWKSDTWENFRPGKKIVEPLPGQIPLIREDTPCLERSLVLPARGCDGGA